MIEYPESNQCAYLVNLDPSKPQVVCTQHGKDNNECKVPNSGAILSKAKGGDKKTLPVSNISLRSLVLVLEDDNFAERNGQTEKRPTKPLQLLGVATQSGHRFVSDCNLSDIL